jgi:hypothetical protein
MKKYRNEDETEHFALQHSILWLLNQLQLHLFSELTRETMPVYVVFFYFQILHKELLLKNVLFFSSKLEIHITLFTTYLLFLGESLCENIK